MGTHAITLPQQLAHAADELGRRIADRCVVADIESEGIAEFIDGVRHYDTRVMLDEREHCADNIEMARQAIDYALARGLVVRHPALPHMVRVVRSERP